MATNYREYQPATRPPWHAGEDGYKWSEALGVVKDGVAEGATAAVRQRWLSLCAEDALAIHGAARGWPKVNGESSAQYRARLRGWWSLAQKVGTATGIIEAFGLLGMSNVEVKESFTSGWGRSGGDAGKQRWIWVVIRHPHPFGTDFNFRWGDGTNWGDGHVYGADGDGSLLEAMRWIIRKMRPLHAHCPEIIAVLAGDIVDGTNTSSDGDPDGSGARVFYISP